MSVSTTSTIATLTGDDAGRGRRRGRCPTTPSGSLTTLTLLVGVHPAAWPACCGSASLVENISGGDRPRPQDRRRRDRRGRASCRSCWVMTVQLLGCTGSSARSRAVDRGARRPSTGPTVALSVASHRCTARAARSASRRRSPAPLVVVVGGILLVAFAGARRRRRRRSSSRCRGGLPAAGIPDFSHVGALVPGAFAIAVMAFLESAAVARGIRRPDEPQIDSDQELLATRRRQRRRVRSSRRCPPAGGFSQSAVNQQRRRAHAALRRSSRSPSRSLVALFLGPVLSLLPEATLACDGVRRGHRPHRHPRARRAGRGSARSTSGSAFERRAHRARRRACSRRSRSASS